MVAPIPQEISIHAIEYGRTTLPGDMVLDGGDPQQIWPISLLLYLVDTGNHRILIDAGCDTMPGFVLEDFRSPATALEDYGIAPDSITHVIITHAHHDHIDGIRHFPQAVIHMQKLEYDRRKACLPPGASVCVFDKSCTVADCIDVTHIGGHSPGSSIAEVTIRGIRYVFGGDECYLPVCLQKQIPTGSSFCASASKHFVQTYSAPKYTVLLAHDPNIKTGIIAPQALV